MATTLYGIKTCDTVRKARAYLDDRKIIYRFHDFRVDGLDASVVDRWMGELGWQRLVNKSSTTFRDLPAAQKDGLDATAARRLMLEHPTLIKRPVLEANVLEVGFRPARYDEIFGG